MATWTEEGIELDNGDLIYHPESNGEIQVRDIDGDSLGLYSVDDEEWSRFARYFGLVETDFPLCSSCDDRHRQGKHTI